MIIKQFLPLHASIVPLPGGQEWRCDVEVADDVVRYSEKSWRGPDPSALFWQALTHWLAVNARERMKLTGNKTDQAF